MFLKSIRSTRKPDGTFAFAAVFNVSDNATMEVTLEPIDLVSYATFQLRVLLATGQLWRDPVCEGRTVESADREWKLQVALVLDRQKNVNDPSKNKSLN